MAESGANLTPDKLPRAEQKELFSVCDDALRKIVQQLTPTLVIGVGAFAEARAQSALQEEELTIGCILHPSPASPKANRGWAKIAEQELAALGEL
jgi:single-strand selective monofunctional uracil DNA glycosylase